MANNAETSCRCISISSGDIPVEFDSNDVHSDKSSVDVLIDENRGADDYEDHDHGDSDYQDSVCDSQSSCRAFSSGLFTLLYSFF